MAIVPATIAAPSSQRPDWVRGDVPQSSPTKRVRRKQTLIKPT